MTIVKGLRVHVTRTYTVLLLGAVLIVGACLRTEEPESQPLAGQIDVAVGNAAVVLRASRNYGPPNTWDDAEYTFARPIWFALPAAIPVTYGNSGNHKVAFSYREPSGRAVHCEYRGGSTQPHPETPVEKALGRSYRFERCDNGALVGTRVQATWVKLHVRVGDQKDPTGVTQVELRLGESFPELAPPISPEESIALRDSFSWLDTQQLPEKNPQGLPALHYFLIYVEDREQVEALDEMLIHYSPLPLFSKALARWDGQQGLFTHAGDGTGLFVFAMMPAVTYNMLRQAALDGDVMYRVIRPWDVPGSALGPDGSISYDALRASGFRYLDQDPPTDDTSTIEQPLFGRIVRKVVAAVVAVVKAEVRAVQLGIGLVDRWGTGSVGLTVALDVRNTDPAFGGRVGDDGGPGLSTPMQRAWGARAGQQVTLPGVRVTARQRVLGGLLPTKFTERTNDDGTAQMGVARGRDTSICLASENDAAQVTQFLLEMEVCDFRNVPGSTLEADFTYRLFLQHRYFSALAQATEGRTYLREVVGFTPRKAEVLVGPLANLIGLFVDGGAFGPAFGFPNLTYDATVKVMVNAVAVGLVTCPGIQSWHLNPCLLIPYPMRVQASMAIRAAEPLYAVDLIISDDSEDVPDPTPGGVRPGVTGGTFDENFDSRGVITHEYGHFALASMLYAQGVENISIAYSRAILQRMTSTPDPDDEGAYLNEAFADFFASQVAGGTNYYTPPTGFFRSLSVDYCQDTRPDLSCMETDQRSRADFDAQINRIVTILSDAYDGWERGDNLPGNGAVWMGNPDAGAGTPPTQPQLIFNSSDLGDGGQDEPIVLAGDQIRRLIERWDAHGNLLEEQPFLTGLADTMRESGFSWCEQCALFSRHDERFPDAGTDAQRFALCAEAPIRTWIGPRPDNAWRSFVFQPGSRGKDAYVISRPDVAASPSGDHPFFEAMTWTWNGVGGIVRGYIEFDVTNIPSGTQITSAQLTLFANATSPIPPVGHSSQSGSNAGVLRRVLAPWDEATLTWNNQPGFDTSAGVSLPQSTSNDQTYNLDVTSMVQEMVDNPASNHGFMVQLLAEQPYRALRFWSSDAPDRRVRPQLRVVVPGCF